MPRIRLVIMASLLAASLVGCIGQGATSEPEEVTALPATFANVATASGTDQYGTDVPEDSDTATVRVTAPGLGVTKTRLSGSPVQVGEAVQFQVVVSNSGTGLSD